ncbi:MAG: response regulator transcription factor [Pseudomonadota bacterium]
MTNYRRVLIVEDDQQLASLIAMQLGDTGYETEIAHDGKIGLNRALSGEFGLIVLDWMLPGVHGVDICQAIRSSTHYTPILMLTAKSTELDRITGLESGADDFLTKPFSVLELNARVKAIFRRSEAMREDKPEGSQHIQIGELTIDPRGREAQKQGIVLDLTGREFDLLLHFARSPGRVFSREQLLNQVWGYAHNGYEHTVNSHINRLRAKIETDPRQPDYILTVWGAGYKMRSPIAPDDDD